MSEPLLCEVEQQPCVLADYKVTVKDGPVVNLCALCMAVARDAGKVEFTIEEIPGRFDDRGVIR